jgi:hypothetical protein
MNGMTRNRHFGIEKNLAGSFMNIFPKTPSRSRLHNVNTENLKTVIAYLTQLKNIGKLTDKEFSVLLTQACANFVENEIASVFDKVLVKSLKEIFGEYTDEWQ